MVIWAEGVPRKRDLGVEAQHIAMTARRTRFQALFDFSVGRGLEIGPLDAAIAVREHADVRYVDVFGTEGIRQHYADDPNVILELIPDIDYPLVENGRVRRLDEAAAAGAPFEWVIASHVIEHVPDVIGWLQQLAAVVSDGGALVLAVPDRRYCFDVHRPQTTTGQALAAFESGDTRPTVRAIYDFMKTAVAVDTPSLLRNERPPGREAIMHDFQTVRGAMDRGRAGKYVDCHVWTYTPQALVEQIKDLRELDLCDWYVEHVVPVPNDLEFHAVLRRLPRTSTLPSRAQVEELAPQTDMPDWLFDQWTARDRIAELEGQVRRLRRRNKRLQRRVAAVEGSMRMRIGTAIVGPASALRRRLRSGR